MEKKFKYNSKSLLEIIILTLLNLFLLSVNGYADKNAILSPPIKTEVINKQKLEKINDFTSLGLFKTWEAFSMISEEETICWISTTALEDKKSSLNLKSKSTLIVSIRLEKKERNELAYKSKQKIETENSLNLVIDNVVPFNLIPQGQWAWLQSSIDESRFILASQKGIKLRIKGKTINEKPINETYSLLGFTDAYKVAFDACSSAYEQKDL
jgi:hypothetical protein